MTNATAAAGGASLTQEERGTARCDILHRREPTVLLCRAGMHDQPLLLTGATEDFNMHSPTLQ